MSVSDIVDRVLQAYKERFKDDFVLFVLEFERYDEMRNYFEGLSITKGSFENAHTSKNILVHIVKNGNELVSYLGGQLNPDNLAEIIAACERLQISYHAVCPNEDSWYAHELRRFLTSR
jgi:hypothetical protein